MTPPPNAPQITITELVDRVNAALPRMSKLNPNRHLMFQLGHGLVEIGNACEVQQRRLETQEVEITRLREQLGAAEQVLRDQARRRQRRTILSVFRSWTGRAHV